MTRKQLGLGGGITLGLFFGAAGAVQSLALGVALAVTYGVVFGMMFGAASGAESEAALARRNVAAKKPLPRPLGL
jgi:hypothetical protein